MHEVDNQNRMSKTQWRAPHYGMGAGLLVVGLIAGRAFFPLEIPKAFIVEKEKRIEVPVERIVIQKEPFEVIKYVDRIVEKRVEVPVEKIVYRDTATRVDGVPSKVYLSAWRSLAKGQSKSEVIAALGHPVRKRTWTSAYEEWYYANQIATATVTFYHDSVFAWREP
jgi:hypothetical protein